MGSAVHGEAAKREKKLTFYANESVDGLQLSEYLADFGKWGTILIVTSFTLSMPYFTSGGHFSDLLRRAQEFVLKFENSPCYTLLATIRYSQGHTGQRCQIICKL